MTAKCHIIIITKTMFLLCLARVPTILYNPKIPNLTIERYHISLYLIIKLNNKEIPNFYLIIKVKNNYRKS